VGDRTPIHNANVLACALLARLWRAFERSDFRDAARAGVAYTVSRQRSDGSWPYAELEGQRWVDGFDTGYLLDSLRACLDAGIAESDGETAWHRGMGFYARELIDADGTPKPRPESRAPVDAQCAAQAIKSFAIAGRHDPQHGARAWQVARFTLTELQRSDGAYVFQRGRAWTIRTPHPRGVQAPMLSAFAHLLETPAP
jgi:hypothetical protein